MGTWSINLTLEQRETAKRIRREHSPQERGGRMNRTEGWSAYMMPSVGPAKYFELRHYMTGGNVARWVIERDGSVSMSDCEGRFRELSAA